MVDLKELTKQAQNIVSPQSKVLAIGGSPRKNGNTDILIQQIISGLEAYNIQSKSVNLGTLEFKGCLGCEKCRRDKVCTRLMDDMSDLYPDIIEAKALILVSPVHNYNITSWMKAFIDRMYCFYNFNNDVRPRTWSSRLAKQNRKVVISAICEQQDKKDMGFALEVMKEPMCALGYELVGSLAVFKAFEKGAVTAQTESMKAAFDLGLKLGDSLMNT